MARAIAVWAALATVGLTAADPSPVGAAPAVVARTIGGAGTPVPPSFAGFSIEYPSVLDYFGPPGKPNEPFIQLLRTLGGDGVGTPTIRLGGNSGDATWWNPAGRARPAGVETDLTPASLSMLRPATDQAGARFVFGGNLAIADPANAVSFVQAAVAALPPGAVEAYELGNEADLFDRAVTFHVGKLTLKRPQRRPSGYSVRQYLTELDRYIAALNAARGPGWPELAVGGFARLGWQLQAPAVLDHTGTAARFFQSHGYPLNRCRGARVRDDRWREALLGSTGMMPVARASHLVRIARPRGVAVRASEINSVTCGGARGVSDSFASALWGADVLFEMAKAGVAGVNFHTWTGAWYSPISFFPGRAAPRVRVRPLLYGMLLFDRTVANGARLLRVAQHRNDVLKVWATQDAGATVRAAVINKDPRRGRLVRLRLPDVRGSGSLERLLAPALASKRGVTLGGRSFERTPFDGRLHGTARRARVPESEGTYSFRVPVASAALLTVRSPGSRSGNRSSKG
jgi:hypothetical protein